ncbi:3D domain-containing protein [soil metagenome]
MRFVAAAAIAIFAIAFPAMGEPISYEAAVSLDSVPSETPDAIVGSSDDTPALSAEQSEMMARSPDWRAHASLYHAGGGGATGNDSLGCRPVAMRTVAVDPHVIPRHTRLFIRETVGMLMPDGSRHDGFWYASDTGGAIKGQRVDLYTGNGSGSMRPAQRFNQRTLTVANAGRFEGCPQAGNRVAVRAVAQPTPVDTSRAASAPIQMASN